MKISRLHIRPRFIAFLFLFLFLFLSPELWAQVGNNNPTGVAGMFNGNVTTGCSYDPFTANATRTVIDMTVASAVGDYGLSYARTWNSRTPGGWQHPYNWKLETGDYLMQPQSYTVSFPDGREELFTPSGADIYFRAAPGVRERLIPWTTTNGTTGFAYLVLPDGGKIEFSGTRSYQYDPKVIPPVWWEFYFIATALIDPHGRRTTLANNVDGSLQITEPAGRWITVYYTPTGLVDYIKASDNREVHYTYQTQAFPPGTFPYTVLASVVYYNDSLLTATYTYQSPNVGGANGVPLLATCDDPMYAGPMKQITYLYRKKKNSDGTDAVYGQISSEKKTGTTGSAVTTLDITGADTRRETRADGKQRTFTYAGGYLTSWTDFKGTPFSQNYDGAMYVSSVTDGMGNVTDFTNNPLTGAVTQIQYPATPSDTTPPTNTRGTVTYAYGGDATCPDPNNADPNNPYYLCGITDEAGHETLLTRDSNKQITRIDYPDTGYETFTYDYSLFFGQLMSHQMKTGGIETFTYDGRGLRQEYRNPDNPANAGNPTARYQYDTLDRVSGVTDVLGGTLGDADHTTNYEYNNRGQVTITTLPVEPVDNTRHTIVKSYNPNGDGTLVWVMDQLGHTTSYAYDDYRRLRSVTTPLRFTGDSTRTTYFSYDRTQGVADDYTHTDTNVTRLTLPSTNVVKTTYDENYRKSTLTASAASGIDAATTSYGYDNAGNLTSMLLPDEQQYQNNNGKSTTWEYDERNRLKFVKDPLDQYTRYTYDEFGHKKTVTQPNLQLITYDEYDSMNRLSRQTVKQTAQMDAVTRYTYEPGTGLHMTMQDPRLNNYTYEYDQMGRARSVTYPPDSGGIVRSESFTYDTAGRPQTYTNRAGQVQIFFYDTLHRQTGFFWSAGAPGVSLSYDPANRPISISNANAAISRTYFDDNLLKTETQTATGGTANTVTYAWNADANRDSIVYPSLRKYRYNYTGRDQLKQVQENVPTSNYQAEYVYDVNGNMATRKVGVNVGSSSVMTDASVRDALGRCTHLAHQFTSGTRTFDYIYDTMGNRTSIQRDAGTAETYGYDLAQQVTTGVDGGNAHTYGYDANGNRTALDGGGSYGTNLLNQQTTFNGLTVGYNNPNGNVSSVGSTASYLYDAQNRLTSVTNGSTTSTFNYDGLNRKISQTVAGVTTYNVWDGWNLIEERDSGNTLLNSYVYGAGEIIERITGSTSRFYYQDGLGSTSHLSDASGTLLEAYKYGTFGQTSVYALDGGLRKTGSSYDVRHLYTGQLWMPKAGLYDYRNRVYSPTLTRFLQPDPAGFGGDATNLYRYCGNNAVNLSDPSGLGAPNQSGGTQGHQPKPVEVWYPWGVVVRDTYLFDPTNGLFGAGPNGPGRGMDWGPFNGVMGYLSGGDHLTPGNFAGLGEPGAFSLGSDLDAFSPPNSVPGYKNLNWQNYNPSEIVDNIVGPVTEWLEDHMSVSLNINVPAIGGNLDGSHDGVYLAGNTGPLRGAGEATLTGNLNFGTSPNGFYVGVDGALGVGFPAGRFSVGWAPGTGFFGGFGAGYGYAFYLGGATPGYGGYVYRPRR